MMDLDTTLGDKGGADAAGENQMSMDEMRSAASNWSLAGDAGLLLFLKDFSQQLLSKTHKVEEQVNELVHEAKLTGVRLENSFNDFSMLANTQFVENRVYDEDESETNKTEVKAEEKAKTSEQKESELILRIQEALTLGMDVVENAFEKLDVGEANSSDDEESDQPQRHDLILEPKDPYLVRGLPHMIGSLAFMQDDNVGLVEEYSDEAECEHDSMSESESESAEEEVSEDSRPLDPRPKAVYSDSEDEETDSDLFEDESDSDEENFQRIEQTTKQQDMSSDKEVKESEDEEAAVNKKENPRDFQSELSAKLGLPTTVPLPKNAEKTPKERKPSLQTKKSNKEPASGADDLFSPVGKEDEEDDPFSSKAGMFSSRGGLFDDDEEDMFSVIEKAPPVRKTSTKSQKVVAASKPTYQPAEITPAPAGGLFDIEDDDMFAAPGNKQSQKSASTKKQVADLFGDENDEKDGNEDSLFSEVASTPQPAIGVTGEIKTQPDKIKKKLPAGAVSIFGNAGNPLVAAIKKQQGHTGSDSENDGDSWSGDDEPSTASSDSRRSSAASNNKAPISNVMKPPNSAATLQPSPAPSSNSLFAEEPEEPPKSNEASKTSNIENNKFGGGLFDDEDDDLFASSKTSVKPRGNAQRASAGLLFENDNGGDLFSTAAETKNPAVTENQQKVQASSSKKTKISLFEDEDGEEDDFFESSVKGSARNQIPSKKSEPEKTDPATPSLNNFSSKIEIKPPKSVLDSEGEDLFSDPLGFGGAKPKMKAQEKLITEKKEKKVAPKSIAVSDPFGLGDDAENDMFASLPTSNTKSTEYTEQMESDITHIPASKEVDLFDEDLFASTPSKVTKPTPKVKASKMVKNPFSDENDLFGSSREEPKVDLFGSTSPLAKPKVLVPESEQPCLMTGEVEAERPQPPAPSSSSHSSDREDSLPKEEDKPKPWKPAGAVSMFGGMNPADLLKKSPKTSVDGDHIENDDILKSKVPAKPSMGTSPEDLFSSKAAPVTKMPERRGPQPFKKVDITDASTASSISSVVAPVVAPFTAPVKPPVTKRVRSPGSLSPPSRPNTSSVGKLQTTLAINPNALLTGAAPERKEDEGMKADFEEPTSAPSLQSLGKSRAKLSSKRRPPSRPSRRGSSSKTSLDDKTSNESVPSTTLLPSTNNTENHERLAAGLDSFMGKDSGIDIPPDSPTGSFSRESPKFQNRNVYPKPLDEADRDLLSTNRHPGNLSSSQEPDLFSSNKTESVSARSATNPSNDNFPSKGGCSRRPMSPENSLFYGEPPPLLDDDDEEEEEEEDLFSSKSDINSKTTPPKGGMFDDDDMFADSIVNKPSTKSKETHPPKKYVDAHNTFTPAPATTVFSPRANVSVSGNPDIMSNPLPDSTPKAVPHQDDDIFISTSVSKPEEKIVPPARKDSGEDLFSTVPAPLIKLTKAVIPTVEDEDDIFNTKSSKSFTKPKKYITPDEDLFEDDTDIFADIPGPRSQSKNSTKKKKVPTATLR